MKKMKHLLSLLLIAVLLWGFAACGEKEPAADTQTGAPDTSDTVSQDENSAALPEPEPILYVNPLTGTKIENDTNGSRPIAVMINNIKQALPQEGISDADVLMECLAEGGITRLMGLFSDYKSLKEIGSIRSARPYYLDFAQMFDAIYCHCGGSAQADSEIRSRGINHLNGESGSTDPLDVFYRDPERVKTMAWEHTLMTSGEGVAKTIEHLKYRTTLREGYAYPFAFAPEETPVQVGTQDALHVYLPVSGYQKVDYVYDTATKEYLRYQHNGNKHIDGNNGQQLSFKNIIVLFCKTVTLDSVGHLGVTTTGTGDGYLISEGTYTAITWSRSSRDGNLTLTDTATGSPVVINRGKTVINVCPQSIAGSVKMNATDRTVNP